MADKLDRGTIIQELLKLAVPVGAAVVGTTNKNFLPQAAGLATGFADQVEKQRQEKQKIIDDLELQKRKAEVERDIADKNVQERLDRLPSILQTLGLNIQGTEGQQAQPTPQIPSVAQQQLAPRTQPTPEEETAQQSLIPSLPPQIMSLLRGQTSQQTAVQEPPMPLFATKPSMSFNPITGTMSVNISQVENPQVKFNREVRLAEEQKLRDFRNDFQSLTNFGGTVDSKKISTIEQSLGFELQDQLVAGRGVPIIDEKGNKKWRVLSNKEWDRKVTENKFDSSEIEHLQKIKAEYRAWDNVVTRLSEIGITPESLSNLGTLEFTDVKTPIGVMSFPARFNLVGQFAKDPKYTAIKRDVEVAFQTWRIRVTGVQASDKELKTLRSSVAMMYDRPGVFFATIKNQKENAKLAFEDRLDLYDRAGRDVSRFRDYLGTTESKGVEMIDAKGNKALVDPVTMKVIKEL